MPLRPRLSCRGRGSGCGTGVVGMDYVRVIQAADHGNLAIEATDDLGIRQKFLANQLEGGHAPHLPMPCLEDRPGAAFAEPLQEKIWAHRKLIGTSEEDLIDLVWRQPAALEQVFRQASRVLGERGPSGRQLIPLRV